MAATEATPAGLTGKAARAWKLLGEHEQRMAEKRGLREFRCGGCQAVIAHYVAPIGMFLWPCPMPRCGHINKYSSSLNGDHGG
jgi:hypothetical protein